MTTTQAAEMLGVSQRSISRYIVGGKLPARRRNLKERVISIDDLRKFAQDNKFLFNDQLAQELNQK